MLQRSLFIILALFLFLYIVPLSVRPLMITDEFRYAEIPREMIVPGNWVSPRLNGMHYFEKPVMGYWLTAGSILLFGENAFSVRVPSSLAVALSIFMIFVLIRHVTQRDSAALLCALMLMTYLEVFAIGNFAVLDSLLSAFITTAMVFFFFASQETNPRRQTILLALFGAFCGLAFLTKGFLAMALPVLISLPFMIWERRWKVLWTMLWVPLVVMVLIVGPWALAIHLREPDFWHYFFWTEHIHRFLSNNPQHPQPFWYFLPVIVVGALPWSVLLPCVIQAIGKTDFKDALFRFALCWFFFPFLFFSVSHGKLLTYVLPCFPPLAIICTLGLLKYQEAGHRKAFTIGASLLAGMTGLLALVIVINQLTGLFEIKAFGPSETWKWMALTAGLLVDSLFLMLAARSLRPWNCIGFFCVAPVVFMFSAHFILPDLVKINKAPETFLREQAEHIMPDTILVVDDKMVTAVCWVYKRNDVYLLERAGELDYGINYPDAKQRLLSIKEFNDLARDHAARNNMVLISSANFFGEFENRIPAPRFLERYGRFIFAEFK